MVPLLSLRGLTRRFDAGLAACRAGVVVLRELDLDLCAGEAVGVVGQSGAGKTTLLLVAAGLLRPDAGVVRSSAERVVYVPPVAAPLRGVLDADPRARDAYLIDDSMGGIDACTYSRLGRWIERATGAGACAVIASREQNAVRPFATRLLALSAGRIITFDSDEAVHVAHARVAEGRRRIG